MPLPIFALKDSLLQAFQETTRIIIEAPTGSGKSTQVPQFLRDSGFFSGKKIIILQPRRLAARLLASYVAMERGTALGQDVGYQIRFESMCSPSTNIKYMTEGILLWQMLDLPTLTDVGAIVFDEFHERHLYSDATLAMALLLQKKRPDLKLVVMSATLDIKDLEPYLAPCRVLRAQGVQYPVKVDYLPKSMENKKLAIWNLAVEMLERNHVTYPDGDVLIFMPGSYEIQRTLQALQHSFAAKQCVLLPLYGEMSVQDQNAALRKYDRRKIVVSTNVAETSITIDGVQLIIDSGLARINHFDRHRGINTLLVEKISRSSADQRKGRAGRTAEGHCIRLWTEHDHHLRLAQETPEIKRLDLAEMLLLLKAYGCTNLFSFPWLEAPEAAAVQRAEILLQNLGAIEGEGRGITAIGKRMLSFPLHPRYSRMLLEADLLQCVPSVALIAAFMQGRHFFLKQQSSFVEAERQKIFDKQSTSDFLLWIKAWQYVHAHNYQIDICKQVGVHAAAAKNVGQLYASLMHVAREQKLHTNECSPIEKALQQCLLIGFIDQLACRYDLGSLRCQIAHSRKGLLSEETCVRKSKFFVAAEINEIEGRERSTILSAITAVEIEMIKQLFPYSIVSKQMVSYDSNLKKVLAVEQECFAGLVLQEQKMTTPPADVAAQLLAEQIYTGKLHLKQWDHNIEQWIVRVNCLAKWLPELDVEAIMQDDRNSMLEQICFGATSFVQVKERDVADVVHSYLLPQYIPQLEQYVPKTYLLPSNKKVKIVYSDTDLPHIACHVQELYGLTETPRLAKGRIPVVVHILAPNQRAVQITQDMANFWSCHYPKIKQELQKKYPKHTWL